MKPFYITLQNGTLFDWHLPKEFNDLIAQYCRKQDPTFMPIHFNLKAKNEIVSAIVDVFDGDIFIDTFLNEEGEYIPATKEQAKKYLNI